MKDSVTFGFGDVLNAIRLGYEPYRIGWNGSGQCIRLCIPEKVRTNVRDGEQVSLLSYVELKTAQGDYVPWTPSQTDMLANDWVIPDYDISSKGSLMPIEQAISALKNDFVKIRGKLEALMPPNVLGTAKIETAKIEIAKILLEKAEELIIN